MSCRTINIEIQPLISYEVSIVEEDGTLTPIEYTEYEIDVLPIIEHEIEENQKSWMVEYAMTPNFNIEDSQNSFTFLYCVAYRHPSLPEWILARWYWNDEWIWTPDWIWRD